MILYNVTRNGRTCVYTSTSAIALGEELDYARVRDKVSKAKKENAKQFTIRGADFMVFVEVESVNVSTEK